MPRLSLFVLALCALAACSSAHPAPHEAPRVGAAEGALSVGSVSVQNANATCPAGSAAGALCAVVQVACSGIPTLGATLVVNNPAGVSGLAGKARYLMPYFSGGPGTGLAAPEQQIIPALTAAQVKTVQVVWQQVGSPGGWPATPTHSIIAGACREATITQWLDAQMGGQVATCAQGFSAGSAGLAYALAYYNAGAWLDAVQLLSGPPLARMDLGCAAPPQQTATTCGVAYSLGYESNHAPLVDGLEGTTGCTTAPSDPAKLAGDSVLTGPSPVLGYAYTKIGIATCSQQSAAAGMSALYESALTQAGTSVVRACIAGGCQGENVLADQAGRDAVVAQFLAICN